jgi:imidazolonepropionase-like amidohydrolase
VAEGREAVTALIALLLAALSPAQADSDVVVLANARIVSVSGEEISKGWIFISKGKIRDILSDDGQGIQSSKIIDLAGKTIIPGLIDAGCTLGIAGPANEDGEEVAPQVRIVDSLDPRSPDLARARQSGVTAAFVEPGNRGVIGGVASVIRTEGRSRSAMLVRSESALKGAIGPWPSQGNYSPRGSAATFFSRRPTTRMGVAWEFRKAFFDARGVRESKGEADPATALLIQALEGKLPVRVAASRATDLETAIQIADELGLSIALEEAQESWKCAATLAKKKVPVLLRPAAGIVLPSGIEPVDVRLDAFTLLTRAGVKTALLPTGGPEGLLASVALAVRHGAASAEALRAVTLTPAEILGVSDRMGSLEKGKDANLVVLSGTPHELTTRVERVMIDGRWVYGEKVEK